MGKIDTSEWKEFRVGDLFDIHPTKAYKCTNAELLDGGDTNVVVNSAYDNGIGGTSTFSPTENGNMITFSDTVDANTIFYQKSPFVGYPHVQGLYPVGKYQNAWTQGSLQYFVTVFRERALTVGFDYGNKFRRDIAANLFVKLPATPDGAPDWAYMESYMANLETKVADSLTLLQAAKDAEKKKVDTREWGEFRVGELFKTQMKGKKIQVPTGANVPMQDMIKDGSTPRITVTGVNNGVFGLYDYCGKNSTEYRVFRNFISVSFLGTVFYQEGEATLDMKVHCLQPNHITLNKYTGNFLVSAIKASLRESSYSDQISSTILPEMTIMLPKDKTGQPDWAYMEEYMRKVERKTEGMLNQFVST